MKIHVVKPGENVYSIARQYNVPPERIITDNALETPEKLVVGQTLLILTPKQVHTVVARDTIDSIAAQYGVTKNQILRNNPNLTAPYVLYPGQTIVISYDEPKLGTLAVNGYAYPFIDRNVLLKTLPYLTYLTLFTYGMTPEGDLIPIDDQEIINLAREYGVAPLMLISSLGPDGKFSNELASTILNDKEVQDKLIDNILKNLKEKNYYGLDIDFEYVLPKDKEAYVQFIKNVEERLSAEGYPVMVALAPKTSSDQKGLLYEAHDYPGIGAVADLLLLMTYEWGFTYGPPMAVAPIDKVKAVLDYAITEIPVEKIMMGVPNYGYDWTLPFVKGVSQAKSVGNEEAVDLARNVNAAILYDETAQAPYFKYVDNQGKQHEVWFEDARSIEAKTKLANSYNFNGVGYWNIMKYFLQNWQVVNSLFDIEKIQGT